MMWAVGFPLLAAAADDFTLWKILTGVVVLLVGNVLLDQWRTRVRRDRLKAALLVDCLETLIKLESADFTYHRTGTDDLLDWESIRKQSRGFIFCSPQIEAKELVTLVGERQARLIVRFYERWETFIGFEKLYADVHAQLVELLAACCTKGDEAAELRHMKEECWEQLKGAIDDMQATSKEMCGISLALFRQLTWPSEAKLARLSEERWSHFADLEAEAKNYPVFR